MNKRQKNKNYHMSKKRKHPKVFTNRILNEIKSFEYEELERLNELLPAVKTAYWWDHSGLMNLIDAQLKYMIKNWDKTHYVDANAQKLEMQNAQRLLDLLIKDEFMDKYDDELTKKYGKLEFTGKTIKRPNETEQTVIETTEYLDLAQAEKEKTKKEFFEVLSKYEDWWD